MSLESANPSPALTSTVGADTPSPHARPPKQVEAIGHHAARGFSFYLAQLLGIKLVNVAGQIVLSWLLGTTDYGFLGLAATVVMFISLIQQAGVREVLVQRGARFARWSGAAFWISLASGVLGLLLILAAAPLAARFYHDSRLTPMILLLAPNGLLFALASVPEAKLAVDLRFKTVAAINMIFGTATMVLSIILAALGCGPYSFIVPLPIIALARMITVWMLVRPPIRLNVPLRRARYLLGDNVRLLGGTLFLTIMWQGDYIILGRLYDKNVVGLYYWAFNLSLQSVYMLAETMSGVLFPSLSKLQAEPQRQRDGLLRAIRAIALVGVPACLAQAVVAAPAVHILFKQQWHPGIGILQVLSLGMAFQVVGAPAYAALKAQGRFSHVLVMNILLAIEFLIIVYIGAKRGAANGVAIAVAIHLCISTLTTTYLALRSGNRWGDIVRIFATPFLAGGLAGGAALYLASLLPHDTKIQWLVRGLVSGIVMAAIYLPLARVLSRSTWNELHGRIRQLLQRKAAA